MTPSNVLFHASVRRSLRVYLRLSLARTVLLLTLLTGGGLCVGSASAVELGAVVARSLENNPGILATRGDVAAARARITAEAAAFDPRFELASGLRADRIPGVAPIDENRSTSVDGRFDVLQPLESGIDVGAGITVEQARTSQRFTADGVSGTQTDPTANTANLRVFMNMPLGRGRGPEQTLFALTSAELDGEASSADREHRVAEVVNAVINAYWRYRAAQASLELAEAAEQRRRAFIRQIDRLIESDQRPASDRNLAMATLTERISERISAEQALNAARIALAELIAVPVEELAALGPASSAFPEPAASRVPAIDRSADLLAANRADLRAADIRHQAAMLALRSAMLDQRPDLSLNLEAGFASRLDGGSTIDILNPDRDYGGPNVGARINYRWSHGERGVSARVAEREALVDANRLNLRAQRNNVLAAIRTSRDDVLSAGQLVGSARDAVALFQTTVEGERVRYSLGVATLIDLLELEDRLDRAVGARIASEREHAQALSRWLFESGQLLVPLDDDAAGFEVRLTPLLTP